MEQPKKNAKRKSWSRGRRQGGQHIPQNGLNLAIAQLPKDGTKDHGEVTTDGRVKGENGEKDEGVGVEGNEERNQENKAKALSKEKGVVVDEISSNSSMTSEIVLKEWATILNH